MPLALGESSLADQPDHRIPDILGGAIDLAHERVPRVLYEYPIVEYIPLEITTVSTGPVPASAPRDDQAGRPDLVLVNTSEAWETALSRRPYAFPNEPALGKLQTAMSPAPDLLFLAVGFRVIAGIYRGRKVSLATSSIGSIYHLFTLPLKYFYKPSIDFVAYTALGTRLSEARAVDVPRRGRGA